MTTAMAGDGRFRYLYARKGAARELLAAAREQLGDAGVGVVARGGARRGPARRRARRARSRAASATSCSRRATTVAFVDPALPNEAQLRSGHGSLTPDEMLVPLVAAHGRAGN